MRRDNHKSDLTNPHNLCGAVELLLTAQIYNQSERLAENDLPAKIRKHYWDSGTKSVKRPINVRTEDITAIYGINNVDFEITKLPFIEFEKFGSELRLTVFDLAKDWFLKQDGGIEQIRINPVLASFYEEDGADVSYEDARHTVRPKERDREYLDSLVAEIAASDDDVDLLTLVHLIAPEDVRQRMNELVLTSEQEKKIDKIMQAIKHREYLREIGLCEIGKMLFIGLPGTGKTSAARALSEKLSIPLVEVRLSMITSQYLGETSKNIDKVFELAKKLNPCILFIDEFDFIAKTRMSDENAALKRAVNTLLKAIDEISLIDDGVLLIGATNHPNLLDRAAWRRFDEIVDFPPPDTRMRKDILDLVLSKVKGEFDTQEIAEITDGFTGSDLRMVVREAVLHSLVLNRTYITQSELVSAADDFSNRVSLMMKEYSLA
uniref:ATP-dependent zinc metalloprotease FtsH n=1 Tax=Candidatus Methanogaster sp. ANME-2c ERB4 TaxID=2759911 RepID=A0A7G9Y1I0_9EURY|nr:ATP-dependent zinc metalloprotease FtsH [Methanosarcinales archaeon ANME-2c ERB4]